MTKSSILIKFIAVCILVILTSTIITIGDSPNLEKGSLDNDVEQMIKSETNPVNERIDKLESQVSSIINQIGDKQLKDISDEIESHQKSLTQQKTMIEDQTNSIKKLKQSVEDKTSEIENLKTQLDKQNQETNELKRTISQMSDKINNMGEQTKTTNDATAAIDSKLSTIEDKTGKLEGKVENQGSQVTELDQKIKQTADTMNKGLQEQTKKMDDETTAITDRVDTRLEDKIKPINAKLTNLDETVKQTNTVTEGLLAQNAKMDNEKAVLTDRVNTHDIKLDSLEKQRVQTVGAVARIEDGHEKATAERANFRPLISSNDPNQFAIGNRCNFMKELTDYDIDKWLVSNYNKQKNIEIMLELYQYNEKENGFFLGLDEYNGKLILPQVEIHFDKPSDYNLDTPKGIKEFTSTIIPSNVKTLIDSNNIEKSNLHLIDIRKANNRDIEFYYVLFIKDESLPKFNVKFVDIKEFQKLNNQNDRTQQLARLQKDFNIREDDLKKIERTKDFVKCF